MPKGKKGRRQDDSDDDFVDPIAAALATEGAGEAETSGAGAASKKKGKHKGKGAPAEEEEEEEEEVEEAPKKLSKAELKKQKNKAKGRGDEDEDEEKAPAPAKAVGKKAKGGKKNRGRGDDSDEDEAPMRQKKSGLADAFDKLDIAAADDDDNAPAPEANKPSRAEVRKGKKGKKGRQDDSDSDGDGFVDPIQAALAAEEEVPVAKKPSKAELKKLKKGAKKGGAPANNDDDDDDDFVDPIQAALEAGDAEEEAEEAEAVVAHKAPSKSELKRQKKREAQLAAREAEEENEDEEEEEEAAAVTPAPAPEREEVPEPEPEPEPEEEEEAPREVEKAASGGERKKTLSKAARKKQKSAGKHDEAPKEESAAKAEAEAEVLVQEKAATMTSVFGKKKINKAAAAAAAGEGPGEVKESAFERAMAAKAEDKAEEDEEEGLSLEEAVARYEKKVAKAAKAGDSKKLENYEAKLAKAKKQLDALNDVGVDREAAAVASTAFGDDVWREDAPKPTEVEESFDEVLAAAVALNGGEKLSAKARKKVEKDYAMRQREAAANKAREQASLEGAQFAVSQTAVDPNDQNWINALDVKIDNFSITVAGKTLFNDATLLIAHGHRYGIVGPNGRGKTTLLKMIAAGELKIPPRVNCLYVEQEVQADDTRAVDAVLRADRERTALLDEERRLMARLDGDGPPIEGATLAKASERLGAIGEELRAIGASAAESKARRILFGLGFTAEMQMRATKLFSGGWRMRISLARALFIEPHLLMLDEPTNHLDLNAVIWLDDYLQKYKHTIVVVSHDQDFLNSVCDEILHISEERTLDAYRGNYDTFKTLEKQKRAQQFKLWEKQEKAIKQLKAKSNTKTKAEELVKNLAKTKNREPGARAKKNQAIALGTESADVARLIEKPKEYLVEMAFPEVAKLSPPVLQVCDAAFKYAPDLPYIFTAMDFGIDQDSRICIVGNNGSGKTTLLQLLTGKLAPTDGEIRRNPRLRMGVYNQHFVERLPMDETPVDYLRKLFNDQTFQGVRNMLGRYGLEGHAHQIAMRDLSGGQKARVVLVELSLASPHMLLLDEPTNNLDIETIEALCDAINAYNGGVICVTHDARLIEATKMRLWVVENRAVVEWGQPFAAYRDHLLQTLEEAMAREDQRVTAAGISVDMGGNRNDKK